MNLPGKTLTYHWDSAAVVVGRNVLLGVVSGPSQGFQPSRALSSHPREVGVKRDPLHLWVQRKTYRRDEPRGGGEARRRAAGQGFHLTLSGNILKGSGPCVGVSRQKGCLKIWVGVGEYLHNLVFLLPFFFLRLGICSFPHSASPLVLVSAGIELIFFPVAAVFWV